MYLLTILFSVNRFLDFDFFVSQSILRENDGIRYTFMHSSNERVSHLKIIFLPFVLHGRAPFIGTQNTVTQTHFRMHSLLANLQLNAPSTFFSQTSG